MCNGSFGIRDQYHWYTIESYVNSHIGFDPDYEVIKNATPKKTPDERMAYLVVVIVQESNKKQFRVCLMSQNRVVVENKLFSKLVPSPTFFFLFFLFLSTHNSVGTLLRNENYTNGFRIRWHSRFCGQNVSRLHDIYRWLC